MNMNDKDRARYMEDLKNRSYDEWFPFECVQRKISFLSMFAHVINQHPDDLSPSYQAVIKKRKIKPSEPLMEYIVMEIRTFYSLAYYKFGKSITFPESYDVVKSLRDHSTAHFRAKTPGEAVNLFENVNLVGFEKIYSEYKIFSDMIFKKLKKKK